MTAGVRPRLIGPALMALAMFCILIGLGVWQVQRLAWKRGLLAAINRAESSAPIPLPAHPGQFQKVSVRGVLRPDLAILYGSDVRDTLAGPVLGAALIQPLLRTGDSPVLIERGWVPEHPATPVATRTGEQVFTGFVRTPDRPHLFTPNDDVAMRRFYTLNPAKMGAALGLSTVAPFTLVVMGEAPATGYPVPATALPRPPNDHLSYAITWFGLAGVLLVVFTVWARATPNRLPPNRGRPASAQKPAS